MIYSYQCYTCDTTHDIWQKMKDKHEYVCHDCGEKCVRVFQKPQVRKNAGFYSSTLGEWVGSQTDFETKLRKVRYITGESKFLNDTSKPKDEWIETRIKKEEKQKENIKKEQLKADMVYHNAQKG